MPWEAQFSHLQNGESLTYPNRTNVKNGLMSEHTSLEVSRLLQGLTSFFLFFSPTPCLGGLFFFFFPFSMN